MQENSNVIDYFTLIGLDPNLNPNDADFVEGIYLSMSFQYIWLDLISVYD
jgi:hypothetical protein